MYIKLAGLDVVQVTSLMKDEQFSLLSFMKIKL